MTNDCINNLNKETDLKEDSAMRVVHYEVLLNSWINNRLEHDRRILIMSFAAIGYIFSFLRPEKQEHYFQAIVFCFSGFSFILCICLVLYTYELNADYIERIMRKDIIEDCKKDEYDKNTEILSCKLYRYTLKIKYSFVLGIFISCFLVALSLGIG